MTKNAKNILVTGAAGFIGSHTCFALLQEGHSVVGVDELNDYYDVSIKLENLGILQGFEKFEFHKMDITIKEDLESLMKSRNFDAIIHLAARAGVRPSIQNPQIYVQANILGSVNVFQLAGELKVQHVVYASSSSVYGSNKKIPFSETDNLNSLISPYAASKKATEDMASVYSHLYKQTSFTGLRFFTVYGPRGRPDMAPFKFVDRIMRGIPIEKYGDGTSSRDYTFISDIVDGILKSTFRSLSLGSHKIYNLGNSSPLTLNEFIETIEKVSQKKAIIIQMDNQPGDVEKTFADISLAQKELNYYPRTKLSEGIKELVKWYNKKYNCKTEEFESSFEGQKSEPDVEDNVEVCSSDEDVLSDFIAS